MMAQTNGTRKKRPCAKVGDSVWIELIVVSVRYAAGKEPGRLAASRVVEGSVALVEDIEFSHDLQSAPAATAVKHRVINYRTAPPAPLLIGLVTAEEPASFDIPTGESWIGDADKGIRCVRKASGAWRIAADKSAARQIDIELAILALHRERPPKRGGFETPEGVLIADPACY